jgi:hypothetical protein
MIEHVRLYTFPAAFSLLPPAMDSPAARAELLAIGLQESRFRHRKQISGPARSLWQFELGGGLAGVLQHHATAAHARKVLDALLYEDATIGQIHEAMTHNDTLACCLARLLLWTVPGRLPGPDDPEAGWRQYREGWRPGKPHRGTWDAFYGVAWSRVMVDVK